MLQPSDQIQNIHNPNKSSNLQYICYQKKKHQLNRHNNWLQLFFFFLELFVFLDNPTLFLFLWSFQKRCHFPKIQIFEIVDVINTALKNQIDNLQISSDANLIEDHLRITFKKIPIFYLFQKNIRQFFFFFSKINF